MIPVTSTHVATLTVPISGDPTSGVKVVPSSDGRSIAFTAQGATPLEARATIRAFLDAARAAAND